MSEHFSDRTRMMLGDDGYESLSSACVAIFGIGGVGGFATEALARAGVGELHLFDSDTVSVSNINRQIIATHLTVGQYKTEAARDRILSINPDCRVVCHNIFYSEETEDEIDLTKFDYIVDAIDSVRSKIALICRAKELGVQIISAMGAGNKLDPTAFKVSDISKTRVCPLAKTVRVALRKRGINHLKVVYSEEEAVKPRGIWDLSNNTNGSQSTEGILPEEAEDNLTENGKAAAKDNATPRNSPGNSENIPKSATKSPEQSYQMRTPPASVSFVPSVMGLIMAGEVILDLSVRR